MVAGCQGKISDYISSRRFLECWFAYLWQTVKPNDLKNIEQVPCARQSFVYGIAGGAAIGCTRFLTSSKYSFSFFLFHLCSLCPLEDPVVASNWAVASFVIISAVSWYVYWYLWQLKYQFMHFRNRCRSLQSSQKEQIKAIQDQMDEKARRAALARRGQPVASSDLTSSQSKS